MVMVWPLTFSRTRSVVLLVHPSPVAHCDLVKLNIFSASPLLVFNHLLLPRVVSVGSCFSAGIQDVDVIWLQMFNLEQPMCQGERM